MPHPQRAQIAHRMHLQLLLQLGQGIDLGRMLGDARYARDVLLVCDALPEHGLRDLAARFRAAELEDGVTRPSSWAQDAAGFSVSRPDPAPPEADLDIDLDAFENPAPPRRRGWLRPSRWFAAR